MSRHKARPLGFLLLILTTLLLTSFQVAVPTAARTVITMTPSAQTEAARTTPAPASTTPTPDRSAVVEFPYGNADVAGEEQEAGLYRSPDWFHAPFTFETTTTYRGIGERFGEASLFGIAQGMRQLPQRQLLFWALVPDYSPEDAVSLLRDTASLTFLPNEDVTVAGYSGVQFDATTERRTGIGAIGTLVGVNAVWNINSSEAHLRFIVLMIGNRALLIYIEAPTDEFEDFMVDVEQVLSTVQFEESVVTPSPTPSRTPTPS
jgi:hypothetical protein